MALDEYNFVKLLCDLVGIDAHQTTVEELIDAYLVKLTKEKNPSPKLKRMIENFKMLRAMYNKQNIEDQNTQLFNNLDKNNKDNEEWT